MAPARSLEGKALDVSPAADLNFFDLESYRERMAKYLKGNGEDQIRSFFDALDFAFELHEGQTRRSGAPYISHPCAVAEILSSELKFRDPVLLAAAVLHDVVEDVPDITLEEIEQRFGDTVAALVDGCTKLTRSHLDRATALDLTHSKIFLSASRRLGVLVIKLADRLHNLRTLHYLPQSKRQRIAQETVEVYAPIAARFNVFPLKRELYHLALSFLYPKKSKKVLQFIKDIRISPQTIAIENRLQESFSKAGYPVNIRARAKGLGSYYDHLKRTLEISNAENYMDFAIILQSEKIQDCYTALGIVNINFTPIPRSLRDFIASPKTNGYQGLHVRIHESGRNCLVKIRTPQMDEWSNYGILREWDAQKPLSDEHWVEVSELLRSIGEYEGAGAHRKALIRLSESEEIFVYSPMGDIYFLPKGSIVLDFAYRIHSDIGDYCKGAYVNGEWSPPTRRLSDGELIKVEISTEPLEVEPEIEEICKTPKARTAISRRLQHRRRNYAEEIGKQILLQELKRHEVSPEVIGSESMPLLLEVLNLRDTSDLFIRIGQDLVSPHLVLYYMGSIHHGPERPPRFDSSFKAAERNTIIVDELNKAVHKFARCCHPYPGQKNVVATLSERGITFHHLNCADLRDRHDLQPQQLLNIEWSLVHEWAHPLVFRIDLFRETMVSLIPFLAHLPSVVDIRGLESATDRHGQPIVHMTVRFTNFKEARGFCECINADRMSVEDYGIEERRPRPHADATD